MTCFAPDTLAWEAMDMGHSSWVHWLLSGRLETFYDGLRRPGRREEAAALNLSQSRREQPAGRADARSPRSGRRLRPAAGSGRSGVPRRRMSRTARKSETAQSPTNTR
ncbi:DUF2625 family protein [Streptomyces sp. NPDC001652]|uniref:DUF2625 family protein n=1 Tax=Streptomyces sp. NPDC001652 TaxID=3154393 RepID=UPI00332A7E5D